MKIKAFIIDDEPAAVMGLSVMLKEFFTDDVEIAGTAHQVIDALKLIKNNPPDVIFLDIEMPGGTGFDFLEAADTPSYKVVFTTAYDHYAIKAIKNNAFDYLLKPISISELGNTIAKLKLHFDKPETRNATPKKIQLATRKETKLISPTEIIYIEADGRYSKVYFTNGGSEFLAKNIGDLQKDLPEKIFFRIHKSYLVNCDHVKAILHEDGGFIELSNGKKIEVSRRNKAEFSSFLKNRE